MRAGTRIPCWIRDHAQGREYLPNPAARYNDSRTPARLGKGANRNDPRGMMPKARILTMPARPEVNYSPRERSDPRYIEGQRLLVEAIRYLVQADPEGNLPAVELLSEHFRTKFRSTDHPPVLHGQG